ncbi:ABC transporter substrate-binding protein [Boseaceae bacterium BT-24-1]|nr:ABC transporter substrate-binding protein [Boseaceae bacterium BT-24-1]
MRPISPEAAKQFAPTGTLRAAINFGNPVIAQRLGSAGTPAGVAVDLSDELGSRLGVPVELVAFEAAGKVFEAGRSGVWDVAFFGIEPERAAEVDFTAPYLLIEGTYMVPAASPLRVVEDVDQPGVRIAVGRGSAYDLFLTRAIRHATIVRAATGGARAMIDLFLQDQLEAVAGVRQALAAYADSDPAVRVMDGRFMEIRQAMGMPKGRAEAMADLSEFIEDMKASGFITRALARSNQHGVLVAPLRSDIETQAS